MLYRCHRGVIVGLCCSKFVAPAASHARFTSDYIGFAFEFKPHGLGFGV